MYRYFLLPSVLLLDFDGFFRVFSTYREVLCFVLSYLHLHFHLLFFFFVFFLCVYSVLIGFVVESETVGKSIADRFNVMQMISTTSWNHHLESKKVLKGTKCVYLLSVFCDLKWLDFPSGF